MIARRKTGQARPLARSENGLRALPCAGPLGGSSMTGNSRRRLVSRLRSDLPLALVDVMLVAGSSLVLLAVRFNGDIPSQYQSRLFAFLPVIILVQLGANLAWGLYGQIWKHASVAEARRIVFAGASAGLVIFLVNPTRAMPVPRSVALLGAFLATMMMGAARFQGRLRRRGGSSSDTRSATRVAVVGAGDAGATIVREMRRPSEADRVPVVIVDDDPRKQGRSMLGVPVVGDIANLPAVVAHYQADEVLIAIPSADQQLINEIMEGAELAEVPLKVLPPVRELLNDRPSVRDARDINIEDLLGRAQVATDIERIRAVISGATVLITGAGGSIGSEIAKQVAELGPARLVLLDHDETHLHDVNGQLERPAELDLTDIRDRDRIAALMRRLQPDVVFHAAAHKHVPLLEGQPTEAVRTNVLGTAQRRGRGGRRRRRPAGLHLVRQGGAPVERARLLEVARRAARPAHGARRLALVLGALRQRARQPGQRHPHLRPPDLRRRPGHGHRPPHDPLLHERARVGAARAAGVDDGWRR